MEQRNRAEGWKHAKLSGHENEALVKQLVADKGTFQSDFLLRMGKKHAKISSIEGDCLNETDVPSVLGGYTKSKTDLYVTLDDGTLYKISIKKSLSGQVYLIRAARFIAGFEEQYSTKIPERVKRAISLFWGSAEDTLEIVDAYGKATAYEKRKNRLVADTLRAYDKSLYYELLNWFETNTHNIFDFCFSKGLAKYENDWANVVWYVNELGENAVNEMFLVDELSDYFKSEAHHKTEYGNRGGGTTIQLAFGFVQWHSPRKTIPGEMQFHHNYNKITKSRQ